MDRLMPLAERAGTLLKARGETIAVAESSTGGLVSAALLALPGASAYFVGGSVVYTRAAREALLGIPGDVLRTTPPASEAMAALLADAARRRLGATWGLGEAGAAGPTGNRYGHAAGHGVFAVAGPVTLARTIETGSTDRADNMRVFGVTLLGMLVEALEAAR
ncbi:CinA family protein [Roseomonas sp. AR75]|jgi:PncC family amidohydrolase|uniref:CinA family protein n=1 Tax=Roseomonas sp. AR75 TaxID=2562311 RepID=UPI0010BFC0C3|nr:CinA family protein [Roseomonas sp. AR75]